MPKTKTQKQTLVSAYKKQLADSQGVIFLRPIGLTANETVEFKKALNEQQSEFRVIKNTLFKIALKESNMPEVTELTEGANAVIFCGTEITTVAKLVKEFKVKLAEKLETSVGILEGNLISKSQVNELADMPSREVIIAQIAGILTNAVEGVANVLQDSVRGIAYAVNEAAEQNKLSAK